MDDRDGGDREDLPARTLVERPREADDRAEGAVAGQFVDGVVDEHVDSAFVGGEVLVEAGHIGRREIRGHQGGSLGGCRMLRRSRSPSTSLPGLVVRPAPTSWSIRARAW